MKWELKHNNKVITLSVIKDTFLDHSIIDKWDQIEQCKEIALGRYVNNIPRWYLNLS